VSALLAGAVFGGTIGAVVVRQLLRRGPPVWAVFSAGALLAVATGELSVPAAGAAVAGNATLFGFLLALFVFAAALESSGALEHGARWLLGRTGSGRDLPPVLFVAFAALSAFVLNDAVVVVATPLVIAIARQRNLPPKPLLLALMLGVTVGSVPTPFGNPQNLLISLDSGLSAPVATFLRYLLLPTGVSVAVGALWLRHTLGPRFSGETVRPLAEGARVRLLPEGHLAPILRRAPVLIVFPVTMSAIVTVDLASAVSGGFAPPLAAMALVGAGVTLALTPGRTRVVRRVDWTILLLFAALFVTVAGAVEGGLAPTLESVLAVPSHGAPAPTIGAIVLSSAVGSQLVSNVPWAALELPVLVSAGYGAGQPWAFAALAGASTLAGNLTLLGAASNLIVVERAEREGIRIGLLEFVRDAAPIAAISLAVLFACLVVGL